MIPKLQLSSEKEDKPVDSIVQFQYFRKTTITANWYKHLLLSI